MSKLEIRRMGGLGQTTGKPRRGAPTNSNFNANRSPGTPQRARLLEGEIKWMHHHQCISIDTINSYTAHSSEDENEPQPSSLVSFCFPTKNEVNLH